MLCLIIVDNLPTSWIIPHERIWCQSCMVDFDSNDSLDLE